MPAVTFIDAAGTVTTVSVAVGDSIMDGALDNGVAGILGQCGGGCTCSTCHCYVESPWVEQLPAPHPDEVDLLEYAVDRQPDSRLACQVKVTARMDGIRVRLPRTQLPE